VAVGNFDGVHRGHATIVARLRGLADRLGVPAVALTFDPHPAAIVRPASTPVPLTTLGRRAELLGRLGVDAMLVQPTTPDLISLSAERFYAEILRERLGARGLVEGEDFRFGAGRTGDIGMLRGLCDRRTGHGRWPGDLEFTAAGPDRQG
jgi:riboflavin kinase/FMN adenylyltransferase